MYFDFDEPKAPTGSTFKDMPMEPAVDNHGLIEIYRQIMLIDLFQTQFGGWITNQPVHIKLLMALLLLILLAVIAFGFYKAYGLNMALREGIDVFQIFEFPALKSQPNSTKILFLCRAM